MDILLPTQFKILLFIAMVIACAFHNYSELRLNPTIESPINWKIKKPSKWFHFLLLETLFFKATILGFVVTSFFNSSWKTGIGYILIYFFLTNYVGDKFFDWFRRPDNMLLIKSLCIPLEIFTYFSILNYLQQEIVLLNNAFPIWSILIVFGAMRILPICFVFLIPERKARF